MDCKFSLKTLFVFLVSSSFVQAQPLGGFLPGSVKPEQVSEALTQQPRIPTEVTAPISAPEEKAEAPGGEAAKKIKFKLNGIILVGNRVFPDYKLRALFRSKLHKTISVSELFSIVQDITNYYRNNGYIISRAILPPQHVKNGVVKVQIIEGFLEKVDVTGNPMGAKPLVMAFGRHIVAERPLEIKRMEKFMLLANEIPGTQVKAVLAPSKKTIGAADLTLVTENKPFFGYLSYDNYGTRYIGPQQMTANAGFTSMLRSGDVGQATFTKTPKGRQLTFVDMNYNTPFRDYGSRWLIGGTKAVTNPLFVLQPLHIRGVNYNYYTSFQYPMIRNKTQSLTLQAAFNYLDSRVTAFDQLLYVDHIRSIGFGGTFNFVDRFKGANLIYADVRQGLPIFDYTHDTNPETALTSRPGGHALYTKFDLSVNRLQAIQGPFSAYLQFKSQYGASALLASEQFAFGGSILGRGYDVAEILGDKGIAGSAELRYDWNLSKIFIRTLQLYTYYDWGIVWNYLRIGGVPLRQSGTALGFGTRFYFTKYISGNLMWTQVLTKDIAAQELIGRGKRPRVFFSVVMSL